MFELKQEHMDAFNETADENFVSRACVHVRTTLPDQTANYSDEDLGTRVRGDAGRADSYGLTWERSKVRFIETSFLLGQDFDRNPHYDWAGLIPRDQQFGQDARCLALIMCASRASRWKTKEEN